jgi:hypothetical protein
MTRVPQHRANYALRGWPDFPSKYFGCRKSPRKNEISLRCVNEFRCNLEGIYYNLLASNVPNFVILAHVRPDIQRKS